MPNSFIDFLASDVWSEQDIVARTEAMIHSEFSLEREGIINRKVTGAALGAYRLTVEEGAELQAYQLACEQARQAGNAARADMALLREAMAVEAALRRLAMPAVELDADAVERAAAQVVVDAASEEVVELVARRSPQQDPPLQPASAGFLLPAERTQP